MEKKNLSPKSHLELLIPDKKHKKQKEDAVPHGFTEEDIIRNEAWHGKNPATQGAELPKHRATVYSFEETRIRKTANESHNSQGTEGGEQRLLQEERTMTTVELREAREGEEQQIKEIAQRVFEGRMRGDATETIDAMLAEKGIKPWSPEAEEFMRKWDWEQAEKAFAELARNREEAVLAVNEPEPKKHIELQEYQEKYVDGKFEAFNINLKKLPQELKDEFETLTYGQRLLLAENLQQLTLGRIQEEAQDRYQKAILEATLLTSKLLGRVWQGVSKKYQIAKHEQSTALDIKQGGLAYHGELLKQLIDGTKRTGLDAVEGKGGMLELQYVEPHPLMTERQKEETKEFNRVATLYGKIPYEWSLATATSLQKQEYERVAGQFEKAKEHILRTEQGIIGDEQTLLFVADMEHKIRLNQFLNTHPDAEKQIASIESDTLWKKVIGNVATERGIYFGAGVAARTSAIGLFGAVGLPLAAVGMGGWMARKRAAEMLRDREQAARKGKRDISRDTRTVMGTASTMADKIDTLLKKIESESNEEKRAQLVALLDVRLMHTEGKVRKGAVDFGGRDHRIINQYHLSDALTRASAFLSVRDAELGTTPETFKKDIEQALRVIAQSKNEKISQAQKDYLRKQMIYGAGLGIGFFSAGRYAQEIVHAAGDLVSPSEAHASAGAGASQWEVLAHQKNTPAVFGGQDALRTTALKNINEIAIAGVHERGPIVLDIGTRGPEGAFIDELKKHPEIVERLGIKDIGGEAHDAWTEFAKQQLSNPDTLEQLKKLGYSADEKGYADMMHRIAKGKILLEERDGKLLMHMDEHTEYLKSRPKGTMLKEVIAPREAVPADIPNEPQILDELLSASTQTIPMSEEHIASENIVEEIPNPQEDAAETIRRQPSEGILSLLGSTPRPSVEVFVDGQFGLDGAEYGAIKRVKVETLLKQIPSRDEAWAIWRGDVPGKEITLPHDGIYGAVEFKKHIDLAEHIRGLHPDDAEMQGDVDAFMKAAIRNTSPNEPEQVLEAREVIGDTLPVSEVTKEGGILPDSSYVDVMPEAISVAKPIGVEDIPTVPQVLEDVSTEPQPMDAIPGVEKMIDSNRLALLEDDIYNSKMPVQKIITHYKVGNITAEDLQNFYSQKVAGGAKSSPELIDGMRTTMRHAAGEGTPQQQLMAKRTLELIIRRLQGIT
ncbi:MAG: hypothetical protein UY31_C0074G0002 [Candidatus Wolfebacteria bacterium GW2011_GWE1_48_7]|uniref:Uncharacterized protein n=2 Tax=Candidatus Wolfeibacteriota TaxID=1752735 RepID=A0A0G1U5P8_9BACT|nr:MAG: hypothetical protein UX70_C0001G0638 [Candidatus Wolfebacteria bacterium GW2011_GWB1_47_1]KKU36525.1 MAG: hypothetical protein UX49_C0014G0006 [Candidatus Wolfebacteria bacterium GW2011_GWC2_46_275]KKU42436.1 MAG: hypothetical protein UX58_C0002G0150 [Candidatus Wolfebacteria bacterium GW2011_GWB2_46_69]KKU54221.1 MAG: hypothetical protein UX76_C0004G0025 [Candidatus Wolfebacteria bacterium GW2011_GWC1_47_103]KKU59589.1 MAG: hypothetical protein UX83_C0003G0004 [Candidatus Wolfebacteria